MKTGAYLLSTLTAAAASLVLCPASFAEAPQTLNLTIENHQKLVTVKDDNGKWLFAQVMTTPNLKISTFSLGDSSSRFVLQDETGKALWSKSFDTSFLNITPHGEWSGKFAAGWPQAPDDWPQVLDSSGWKASGTDPHFNPDRLEFVVGSDDQLLVFRINDKKHCVEVTPIKNGLVVKNLFQNVALKILCP